MRTRIDKLKENETHDSKETKVTTIEKVIFLILYVVLGFIGMITAPNFVPGISVDNLLELMPIVGAVLLMIGVFIRDEQTSRKFGLANALIYTVYDGIIGTTAIFAQLISVATTSVAIYKYRNYHKDGRERS